MIHCKLSVEIEAFYVVLAVREDKRREVLGEFIKPTERALGWGELLAELQERGVQKIGLVCADGLKGVEDVISTVLPGIPLQHCTLHLKRNLLSCVHNGDKGELDEGLPLVSRTGNCSYTVERAWEQWQALCEKWGAGLLQLSTIGRRSCLHGLLTYQNYGARIQSMIYTTNCIDLLQKGFRCITRMRCVTLKEESILLLIGKMAMDKESHLRPVPDRFIP